MQQKHQQHSQLSEKMFMAFLEHVLGHSAARPGRFPGMSRCNHSRFLRSSPGAWGVVSGCFPRRFRGCFPGRFPSGRFPGADSQGASQRCFPGASLVLPGCFPGAYCFPGASRSASQVLPGCFPGVPKCFLGASCFPRCFPSASRVFPRRFPKRFLSGSQRCFPGASQITSWAFP